MFSIRQVIEALCAYEATHDTGRYVVNGWPVWPFVRIHAAGSKVYAQIEKAADVSQSTEPARHYFPDRLNVARTAAAACVDSVRSPVVPCDVLFLSNSSRRQYYRGRAIQYICDPLADEFAKRGVACSTWQAGLPVSGAYREEIPLRNRLHFLMWKARKTRAGSWIPPEEPEWFREFQVFMQDNLEFQPDWGEYARAISNITIMSRVMERWLNQARPKLVCVDCWYGWAPLAAVIAARRMDIRVCDIQHGIQEFGHYAYHGWKEAYCSMPDSYWVWGERAAGLIKGGPGDFAVLQGGNLWLNMWRSNSSAFVREERDRVRKIVAGRRSTLVTLANPTRVFLERALSFIKTVPEDRLFFLRLHPSASSADRENAANAIKKAGFTNILLREGTDLPLYALIAETDFHVTIDSTCAYEAFAFEKPTVIIDPLGRDSYREFIETRLMFYAETPADFPGATEKAMRDADPERMRTAGAQFFAPPETAGLALDRLCDLAGLK